MPSVKDGESAPRGAPNATSRDGSDETPEALLRPHVADFHLAMATLLPGQRSVCPFPRRVASAINGKP
jgi:hypothetical protein